ncbi:MAG: alpha/beta fold hydrolase [Kofleriaceae bacterium]
MDSIFDRDDFNGSLFFVRRDVSPPRRAQDRFVDVGGAAVHVRLHEAAGARCTLLLFHGNGEVVADYDDAAADFARAGCALAVVDYRGYGRSEGTPTLRNAIGDARAVAESVRGDRPLIAMGRSLGGVAAHELYARPIDGMAAVVLESAFYDLAGLVRRRGLRAPEAFTVEELAAFDPAGKLRAGTLPLLVLHGARDTLIDPSEASSAIAAAGSADKQLVLIPGRGHNDISAADGYWRTLRAFVDRVTVRVG